jgi:hypothetical protein
LETLVAIELLQSVDLGEIARLTYVETELEAVDEATIMVMIRQMVSLDGVVNRANSVTGLLR